MITGDFREKMKSIESDSVDLVFTDPPYDRDSIPLFSDLARESERVLKPGGSLVAYFGDHALAEVYRRLSEHLKYGDLLTVKLVGEYSRMHHMNIFIECKHLLWFVKGGRGGNTEFLSNFIESTPPTKREHEWQQSTTEAAYYIKGITNEGALIVDPMAGSGTTLIAAHELHRNAIGIEIDKQRADVARNRIHNATHSARDKCNCRQNLQVESNKHGRTTAF
jgi:site-specific DNA-methyltransferase (adenine-specific)